MTYEQEDDEEQEEEQEFNCSICEDDCTKLALSFEEKDSEYPIEICPSCWKQIIKHAQGKGLLPTGETKVVEKIIEKPVEKVIYKTIDKNGNEVGGNFTKTKFDCV